MAEWAKQRAAALLTLFGIGRTQTPAHNTLRRLLRDILEVDEWQRLVSQFLQSRQPSAQRMVVSIDGKTVCGSLNAQGSGALHLLAAFWPEAGVVLMQVAVDNKENEIVAMPRVLGALDLRHTLVLADAMHTQRSASSQIVEASGDYIWLVKENQPTLYATIELLFAAPSQDITTPGFGAMQTDFQTATTTSKGHGRLERRTLTSSSLLQGYIDWPGHAQVFKLTRTRTVRKAQKTTTETVYGMTSLAADEASPAQLLDYVRRYWAIENQLHYVRDKTLHEDQTRMTSPTLAQNMATLNNLIIGLAHLAGFRYLPQARRYFQARLVETLRLVCDPPS
jgi:predicted transposase YbfD/YdcC